MDLKEKEVWDKEVEYWESLKNLEMNKYLDLWDNEVVAMPTGMDKPISIDVIKSSALSTLTKAEKGSLLYNLNLYKIQFLGDTCNVMYSCEFSFKTKKGEEITSSDNYLHVWKKVNGTWKIITGMSTIHNKRN